MGLEERVVNTNADIDRIVDEHFCNGNGNGWRDRLKRKYGEKVRGAMYWMNSRRKPENGSFKDHLDFCKKWTVAYGFVSWALGDQRPTRQRQIAKAINLQRDYFLTPGNVVAGSLWEMVHIYGITGNVIHYGLRAVSELSRGLGHLASHPELFNAVSDSLADSAAYVKGPGDERWLKWYFGAYALPRLAYSLIFKKPVPGIGYKTLALWMGIEGKNGMKETVSNIVKGIKNPRTIFSRRQESQYDQ